MEENIRESANRCLFLKDDHVPMDPEERGRYLCYGRIFHTEEAAREYFVDGRRSPDICIFTCPITSETAFSLRERGTKAIYQNIDIDVIHNAIEAMTSDYGNQLLKAFHRENE